MSVCGYTEDEELEEGGSTASLSLVKQHCSTAGDVAELLSSSSTASSVFAGCRQWNELFQQLLQRNSTDPHKDLDRTVRLRQLCQEFAASASAVSKTIISELFVADKHKTIPPITSLVGGVAGGAKYFFDGIFFKLPVDTFNLYGGDEGMIKSAGHELRGIKALLDCRVAGLHLPLMVLCDYRGWRVLAASLLPLGKDTLCYGSSDGACTLHTTSPEMNAKVEALAKLMNLAGEYVWDTKKQKKTFLYLSSDVEGHLGKDNRYYLVDTARLFPPATPKEGVRGGFLINLLRPELVKTNPVPLCADSFSGFGLENKSSHNQEIREATLRLEQQIIPDFAKKLEQQFEGQAASFTNKLTLCDLVSAMHRHGINIRYLGLIRAKISCVELRKYLFTEIIARVFKHQIKASMRSMKSCEEMAFDQLIAQYFNSIFGTTDSSNMFWKEEVIEWLRARHPELSTIEGPSIRDQMKSDLLFARLQFFLGLKLRQSNMESDVASCPEIPFSASDIVEHFPTIKHTHRIFFEEGTALSKVAVTDSSDNLFALAAQKYRESLQLKPNDYRSLSNWGLSLLMQAMSKRSSKANIVEIETLFAQAEEKFRESYKIEPKDFRTLNKWGNCLLQKSLLKDKSTAFGLLSSACEKYSMALNIKDDEYEVLYNWGNALLTQARTGENLCNIEGLLESACSKYHMAASLNPNSFEIQRNWAVALSTLARLRNNSSTSELFSMSYQKYQACVSLKENDHESYFNWANTLFKQATVEGVQGQSFGKLVTAATEKYYRTVVLQPKYFDALNNWARLLFYLSSNEKSFVYVESTLNTFFSSLKSLSSSDLPFEFRSLVDFAHNDAPLSARQQIAESLKNFEEMETNSKLFDELFINDGEKDLISAVEPVSPRSAHHFLWQMAQQVNLWLEEHMDIQHKIASKDFEVLELIGGHSNSFSRVFKVKKQDTNAIYAMKVIRKDGVSDRTLDIRHPFVTELRFRFFDEKRAHLVYDYVSGGPLSKHLKEQGQFSEGTARFYALEIALALESMHSKGLIYTNLNPEKILLDKDGHVRVMQKLHANMPSSGSELLSPQYAAPEILEGEEETPAADWWSFAVIIFEFLSGTKPFSSSSFEKTVESILTAPISFPSWFSPAVCSLLSNLFVRDPHARSTFVSSNLKSHPFFLGVDWELAVVRQLVAPFKPNDVQHLPSSREETTGNGLDDGGLGNTIVLPNLGDDFIGYTFFSPAPIKG